MFPFDPPENIRKPKVFRCFQGDQKGTLGSKGLNFRSSGSKLESVTCTFAKNRTPSQVFFEGFHYKCRTAILKNTSKWLLLGSTLFWKYS